MKGPMPDEAPSLSTSPIAAIIAALRRLFGAERIAGTLPSSVFLGAALTVCPTALLYYGSRFAIAEPRPFVVALVVAGLVAAALVLLLSLKLAPHVAAGLVGAFGYGFFSLSWVPGSNRLPSLTFYWLLTSVIAAVVVTWLLSNSRVIVNIAAVAATGVVAFLIGSSLAAALPPPTQTDFAVPDVLAFPDLPAERPNVYLFVLDGFANPDVTAAQFAEHGVDIDLSESIGELEKLGFSRDVAATSNYGQTVLSVPSMLNASYHQTPDDPLDSESAWATGVFAIRGHNALVHSLRDIGYTFWFSSSGIWAPSSCDPQLTDLCIGTASGSAESMKAVWSATPLRWQLGQPALEDLSSPATVVDEIIAARNSSGVTGPYFTFAHIISPHQPYRYEPDCSLRPEGEPGTTLTDGHLPEYRQLYADQAKCLVDVTVEAMEKLLEVDPDALIFIQADHGSEFVALRDTAQWSDEMALERLSIFRASHLPDRCRSQDPAAQSVINTVPVIVACISGRDPELIEPRYFFTEFDDSGGEIIEADEALVTLLHSAH